MKDCLSCKNRKDVSDGMKKFGCFGFCKTKFYYLWKRYRNCRTFKDLLKPYLLGREADIALDMEDFGSLRELFILLFDREPEKALELLEDKK